MKLLIAKKALPQIRQAISQGQKICLDATQEAMGDKIAIVAFATWLHRMFNEEIYILETSPGRTPFLLGDYILPDGIKVERTTLLERTDYLDVLKSGANNCLWVLNPYLATVGIHPVIKLKKEQEQKDEIVWVPLYGTAYNQRRDMDLNCIARAYELLSEAHNVMVITESIVPEFPYAIQLPFNEVIERISSARVFIGGDTGFTHLSCALGTPTIALYPDWFVAGKSDMQEAVTIGEWWGLPTWYTPYSFIPNAKNGTLSVQQLATDHTFSIERIFDAMEGSLAGLWYQKQPKQKLVIAPENPKIISPDYTKR